MVTDIDISTQALIKLGAEPIQSFTDGTREASVASNTYERYKQEELSTYPWNFAQRTFQLNKLTTTPLNEQWTYAFAIPADYLAVLTVRRLSDGEEIPYQFEQNQVWALEEEVVLDYLADVQENDFPAYFISCLACRLAYEWAESVIGMAGVRDRAWNEYLNQRRESRSVDAQENGPIQLIGPETSTILRARRSGGQW